MTTENLETDLEPQDTLETLEDDVEKSFEERARRMGWRPKDEYGGDKSRWVDARTFIERGETELPILRERFRKQDTRLANTERELSETKNKLGEATQVLVELRDMSRVAEERGYARASADLRDREMKAVAEADTATFAAIQQERQQLEQTRPKAKAAEPVAPPPPAPAAPPQLDPAIQHWIGENPWFNSDRVLNNYALSEDAEVERENPGWPITDKLAEVKRRVMARFPEKFGNPRRDAAPAVAVSTAAPVRSKGKTVRDLPADAKKALERFKKTIPGYTDEQYLKMYFGDEA